MAAWIYTDKPDKNTLYAFKKNFNAKGETLNFKVSANSRYRLYINKEFICEGPCKTDSLHKCYEEAEVVLKDGENEIFAEVLYITENYSAVFPGDEPSFYFEGSYGDFILESDESFLVAENKSLSFVNPLYCNFVQSSEIYEPSRGFSDFSPAKVLYKTNPLGHTPYGTLDKYYLKKRTIPFMKYEEPENYNVVKSDLDLKGEFTGLKTNKNFFVELDARRYVTSFPKIVLKANAGAKIKITYSESYYPENFKNVTEKEDRFDTNGVLYGDSDVIVCDGSEITFSPNWFRSGRFVRLEGENITDIEIREFTFRFYHYDLDVINNFKCSDEEYNKMWEISLNTLKCCMQETYVDCPYYEQQQYLMDTSLMMLYTMSISPDKQIIKKTIDEMSAEIGPEGLLYCNYPSKQHQIIPGFSIFFIFMLKNYLMYSIDTFFIKKYLGTVQGILAYFESKLMPQGYVGPTGYWPFVDWGKDWKRGVPGSDSSKPLTYYSLLYSLGLKWAQEIFSAAGMENTAKDFEIKRKALNGAINRYCLKNGVYTDNPNGGGISEHCQVMAILGDVCEDKTALCERLINDEMTECSFSMSFFYLRVLEECGRYDLADKLFDSWRLMIERNMTAWGESPELPRSDCHGWSAVMLYEFPSVVLGVKPIEQGYAKAQIKPFTKGLEFAEGTVPTPYGNISVKWEKKEKKTILTVDSPTRIVKVIEGKEYTDAHLELEI